jgi:uncharacterized protein
VGDIQEQLDALRRRIALIDRKYAAAQPAVAAMPAREVFRPARYVVEQWLSGEEVATTAGVHFETERLYERHRRHGSMDISDLAELPHDLLAPISGGAITDSCPTKWAFLDTETTGLAGGSGTYAFLIGVGHITPEGFRVRQFFMRDYDEESSLLTRLTEFLSGFDVLITYNGKSYDQPLLETRFRMSRMRPPFERLQHLDLLYGARRLWKLRFESCRLVDLENRILGVEREGDLPGEMIPYVYFEYLRSREAWRVAPILHHNVMDIVTLACLTGVVPWAFHSPEKARITHGAEMIGLARWFQQAEQYDRACELYRRGIECHLRDEVLFPAMWNLATLEKKLGHDEAALAVFTDLAASPNPHRTAAYAELAKHYEHREKNFPMALEMTRSALALEDSDSLRNRERRLERRATQPKPRRLL